ESAMNGKASNSVTKIARIFGTKISVCSWICVSAWNNDTTTPTTRPTTISGDDTTTMVQIASRATSRVSAPVICSFSLFTLLRRGDAKHRTRNPEILRSATALRSSLRAPERHHYSDRHLHDVFVGLDDAVAYR